MFDPRITLDHHYRRHREIVAEMQHQHLAEIVRSGRNPVKPFYYNTLAAFGQRLVSWGKHLEQRYSPVELTVVIGEISS